MRKGSADEPRQAAMGAPSEEQVNRVIGEIEAIDAEIENERELCKERCQPLKEQRKEMIESAEQRGFDGKALTAKVKQRSLRRKADAVPNKLDLAQKAAFEHLSRMLGDFGSTELGKAALKMTEHLRSGSVEISFAEANETRD